MNNLPDKENIGCFMLIEVKTKEAYVIDHKNKGESEDRKKMLS